MIMDIKRTDARAYSAKVKVFDAAARQAVSPRVSMVVKRAVILISLCAAVILTSCIGIAPRAKKQVNVTGNTIKADHRFIVDGVTTKAEVREHLGDVEVDIEEQDLFIGRWKTTTAVYWVFNERTADAGSLWRTRTIWIQYDGNGLVREHALLSFRELFRKLDQWYSVHPPKAMLVPFTIDGPQGGRFSRGGRSAQFSPTEIIFSTANHKKEFTVRREDLEAVQAGFWSGDDATLRQLVAVHFKKSARQAHTLWLLVDIPTLARLLRYAHADHSR